MPEPAPTAVLAAPGWRARLAGADLPGRLLALLLLGAVGAAAGFLLVPPGPPRLPGPEALGTPAPITIKADRDYDIVDEDATARRRAAAAAAERPVYDEDDSADDEAAARIHAAFALMREEEAALRAQRPVAEPAELLRRYASQRDAFVARLQLLVRDEDFAALAAARFGEGVERDLTALATKGLTGLVVGDRALLPEDRAEGFVVRTSRAGDATGSRVVTDLALVRDVATAREEVARAAAARLDGQPAPLRAALTHLATAAIRPTLVHNQAETERRRADAAAHVKPVGLQVKRGERIVSAGEVLEPRHLVILDALRARRSNEDRSLARLGGGALVALLVAALWRFARRALPRFRPSGKDTLLLAVLLGGSMALAAGGVLGADLLAERWPALPRAALLWLVPLAAGAVVARQVLSAEAALLLALATGLGAGLVAGPALPVALQAIVTGLAAASAAGRPRERAGLLAAGLAAAVAGAALAVAVALHAGTPPGELAVAAGAAVLGGLVLVPVLTAIVLPLVEGLLGYVTDARLRRLANLNHPGLKELIVQAPGTYHHAIVMGALVEPAARAIGADALLARVGAYYHDIGKIKNPLLFSENQRGPNEHDDLTPGMSALIVRRHVADGLEVARAWRLPRSVSELIAQHHGTRLVGYFWAKQQKAAEAGGPAADEAVFRYPGPLPRSREAALVMIADACEASSRALHAPTPEQLRALVDKRIAEIAEEGQLEECDLTLRDLSAVAAAMVGALEGIYHTHAAPPPGRPPEGRPPVQLVGRP